VEVYLILYFLGLPGDWRTVIAIEALAVFAQGGTAFIPRSDGGQGEGTVLVLVALARTVQPCGTGARVHRPREVPGAAFARRVVPLELQRDQGCVIIELLRSAGHRASAQGAL